MPVPSLPEMLKTMVDMGGSDLHVTINSPPRVRVHGELKPLDGLDPMGRMMCHSDTYREMTALLMTEAQELCNGRLVVCLEGGYAPVYIPYCGLAVMETLAVIRTEVEDSAEGEWIKGFGGQGLLPAQSEVIGQAAEIAARL